MRSSKSDRHDARFTGAAWLVPVCVAYVLLAGWYAHFTPFGQAPDESAHLPYVAHLVQRHALPVFHPGQGSYEFHQPPLFYLLAAPVYLLAGGSQPYEALRWVNILLGLGVIGATFALVRQVFPERGTLAVASAALVAFLPMHIALCASVTNDLLAEVVAAWTLVVCAQGMMRGWQPRRAALAGALVGLGFLTKSGTVFLIAAGWLAIFIAHNTQKGPAWKPMLICLAWFTGAAALVGGWWLARNQVLYGDAFAMRLFMQAFKSSPRPQYFFQHGTGLLGYLALVAGMTFASFWGVFGNMTVHMPTPLYVFLGLLCAAGLAGAVKFLRGWRAFDVPVRQALLVLGFAALVQAVLFLRFNLEFFQAQARYLFPVLPVWAAALCLGLGAWAGERRWRGEMIPGTAALAVAALAPWLWIIPAFTR